MSFESCRCRLGTFFSISDNHGCEGSVLAGDNVRGQRTKGDDLRSGEARPRNHEDDGGLEVGDGATVTSHLAGVDGIAIHDAQDENRVEIVGVIGVALDQFGHRRIFVLDVRFARGSPGTIGFVATPENIE